MRQLLRSTSIRLAAGYAALFLLSSSVLVGFLWWNTASYLDREIDAVILADARALTERYRTGGVVGLMERIDERIRQLPDIPTFAEAIALRA